MFRYILIILLYILIRLINVLIGLQIHQIHSKNRMVDHENVLVVPLGGGLHLLPALLGQHHVPVHQPTLPLRLQVCMIDCC